MVHRQLIQKYGSGEQVTAGVIGTGHFATAIITQSQVMPQLAVPIVCDIDIEAAKRAYAHAHLTSDDYVICDNAATAQQAVERGKHVIVSDPEIMMHLPIDIVVESTGVPEASAKHAMLAIENGKHIAMVGKEVDVSVGPILKYKAEQAGLIYTAVDGDQHGLLISLVQWAQDIGLDVICGGKALDSEIIFDATTGDLIAKGNQISIDPSKHHIFAPSPPQDARNVYAERGELLGDSGRIMGYDVVEMAIAANATDLVPDVETLHCPILRIPEIPEVLTHEDDGGILQHRGVIDSVICLRTPYEAGLGGGVFIVVSCDNAYSMKILTTKGLISNSTGKTALIYRPYHLCGVETSISLLLATLLQIPTGATTYRPRYDVLAQATAGLKAGDPVGTDHSKKLKALMQPGLSLEPENPLPLHMANGNPLKVDVSTGTILTMDMVAEPHDSVLWQLRREQDAHFYT